MKIIKIKESLANASMAKNDWEELLKLNDGIYLENNSSITLTTTSGKKILIDKAQVNKKEASFTMYVGNMNAICQKKVLLIKSSLISLCTLDEGIELSNGIVNNSIYGGFSILFDIEEISATEKANNKKMKKQFLNPEQLGLISLGLSKNLFPSPSKSDLMVEDTRYGCILYFSAEYFNQFIERMNEHKSNGSYAKSNAESDWLNLMNAIFTAEDVQDVDISILRPHFLAKE
ncbi:MAG: hypothetical protein ABIT08_12250 [Bacteroidia bacterium]